MSISGKISTGMRKPAPMPIRQTRMREATIVYGRRSEKSANHINDQPQQLAWRRALSVTGIEKSDDCRCYTVSAERLPNRSSRSGPILLKRLPYDYSTCRCELVAVAPCRSD